jgi:hypothetical protein
MGYPAMIQIQDIVLFNRDGRVRRVSFRSGSVNIITGASQTGKTAILDIIDYCTGRATCTISAGVLRQYVTWYGLRFRAGDTECFVGRPVPPEGTQSIQDVYLDVGSPVAIPGFTDLHANTNTEGLNKYLSRLLGIRENETEPSGHSTKEPLEATFRQAKFFCLQPQNIIANRDVLFYRQDETFVAEAIKDVLPYFLGAVSDDRLNVVSRVKALRRRVSQLERRLAQDEAVRGEGISRALELASEAQSVGLMEEQPLPENLEQLVQVLYSASDTQNEKTPWAPADASQALRERRDALFAELQDTSEHLRALQYFGQHQEEYRDSATTHQGRLEAVELIPESTGDGAYCPLCSQQISGDVPAVQSVYESLSNLRSQLEYVEQERLHVNRKISEYRSKVEQLRGDIREVERAIRQVGDQEEQVWRNREISAMRSRVAGRISLFLESLSVNEDNQNLQAELDAARKDLKYAEQELEDSDPQEYLASILGTISSHMSQWASELDLEHQKSYLSLSITRLTVMARTINGLIPLSRMGAGQNWVGYHLVALFALHSWFRQWDRPVPAFLALDQPTQVYYPPDRDENGSLRSVNEDDRKRVREMFDFIFRRAQEMDGQLQVIVTDHADLDEEWFSEAVVERWRDGAKLVPDEWLRYSLISGHQ